jgi:hypothetical protein
MEGLEDSFGFLMTRSESQEAADDTIAADW